MHTHICQAQPGSPGLPQQKFFIAQVLYQSVLYMIRYGKRPLSAKAELYFSFKIGGIAFSDIIYSIIDPKDKMRFV